MALPADYATGTATPAVIGTEYDFSAPNAVGSYQLQVDTVNLAAGDILELRVYKMVLTTGTSRVAYVFTYVGAQSADDLIKVSPVVGNTLTDANAIRFTYKQTFGTARALPWKVLQWT